MPNIRITDKTSDLLKQVKEDFGCKSASDTIERLLQHSELQQETIRRLEKDLEDVKNMPTIGLSEEHVICAALSRLDSVKVKKTTLMKGHVHIVFERTANIGGNQFLKFTDTYLFDSENRLKNAVLGRGE